MKRITLGNRHFNHGYFVIWNRKSPRNAVGDGAYVQILVEFTSLDWTTITQDRQSYLLSVMLWRITAPLTFMIRGQGGTPCIDPDADIPTRYRSIGQPASTAPTSVHSGGVRNRSQFTIPPQERRVSFPGRSFSKTWNPPARGPLELSRLWPEKDFAPNHCSDLGTKPKFRQQINFRNFKQTHEAAIELRVSRINPNNTPREITQNVRGFQVFSKAVAVTVNFSTHFGHTRRLQSASAGFEQSDDTIECRSKA